jgi:16S rRNA (cytosine1402-N4)-methyltransferase
MESIHKAVLLHEIVDLVTGDLNVAFSTRQSRPQAGEVSRNRDSDRSDTSPAERARIRNLVNPWYLDGTIGGCGHALAIASALNGRVNIIGLDNDPEAIARAEKILKGQAKQIILERENFRNLDKVLDKHHIQEINMILFDLGISSDELERSGRGFSFQKDEPLLMTMGDPARHLFTAKNIVNNWNEEDIANVMFGYGEERFARRIARAIVGYRAKKTIETSGELAEIVKGAVPAFYRRAKTHPATKTFQALRIAVNDELGALKEGLEKGYKKLASGGKMAVISFHSLEDRIVKDFYKEKARIAGAIITKKPIKASVEEIAGNPRSRSAKLRVIQKI